MARYELKFKRSVCKDLRNIPKTDVRLILKRIDTLAENPRGPQSKKLAGGEVYRVRQGSYLIIYEIQDDQLIIHVIRIAHRSGVYNK